jgi:hypothetical protein
MRSAKLVATWEINGVLLTGKGTWDERRWMCDVCEASHFPATKRLKHLFSRHGLKLGELLNTAQATGCNSRQMGHTNLKLQTSFLVNMNNTYYSSDSYLKKNNSLGQYIQYL